MRQWLSYSLTAALCLAVGTAQAQSIGSVEVVEVWAYGTPPGAGRQDRFVRDSVVQQELLETVENGSMHVRFADGTVLRLGSSSQASLDSYVYDPSSNGGEMTANLTRGAFRYISGQLNKSGVQLRTPQALIGIRGTDILVTVTAAATIVAVVSGIATVANAAAGGAAAVSVAAGQAVSVAANSTAAPQSTEQDVMDPGLQAPAPGPTGPGTAASASGGGGEAQGKGGGGPGPGPD